MNITPDQADQWEKGATDGPWSIDSDYGTVEPNVISGEGCRFDASDEDLALIAAAPDLAQTIAGMRYEYAAQWPDGSFLNIQDPAATSEEIFWTWNLKEVQDAAAELETRLVRRLVGPVEVTEP